MTTFSLGLETEKSECIGIDRFNQESIPNPNRFDQYINYLAENCKNTQISMKALPVDLWWLISEKRVPRFKQGNIILNYNLPQNGVT